MAGSSYFIYLQCVEGFFGRMEVLKVTFSTVENTGWDPANYEYGLVRDLEDAFESRFDAMATEERLRDALRARRLDTQLSQVTLQQLKVQTAQRLSQCCLQEACFPGPWKSQISCSLLCSS